jgi:hypothetical protein
MEKTNFEIPKMRHIEIEIFHIRPSGERENLCLKNAVAVNDFQNVIDLNISWGGIRIRYSITSRHFLDSFVKGIFNSNFDSISEAFRPLFDSNPELIGRSKNLPTNTFINNKTEEFDRIGFIQKLRFLHSEDLGQIIISIPQASQEVSGSETKSKKSTCLITKGCQFLSHDFPTDLVFDPLKPVQTDWEKVLAKVAENLLAVKKKTV